MTPRKKAARKLDPWTVSTAMVLVTFVLLVSSACQSPTEPGAPPPRETPTTPMVPTPTPTPEPVPNVAGSWTGTWRGVIDYQASAELTQQGNEVTGTLTTVCGTKTYNPPIRGYLTRNSFSGYYVNAPLVRLEGTMSERHISLRVDYGLASGTYTLDR